MMSSLEAMLRCLHLAFGLGIWSAHPVQLATHGKADFLPSRHDLWAAGARCIFFDLTYMHVWSPGLFRRLL